MVESTASSLLLLYLVIGCIAPERNFQEKFNTSVIEKNLHKERHAQVTFLYVLHGPCVQESASVEIFQEILSCGMVCRPRLTSWIATVLVE